LRKDPVVGEGIKADLHQPNDLAGGQHEGTNTDLRVVVFGKTGLIAQHLDRVRDRAT
jgi:hypothetical protein